MPDVLGVAAEVDAKATRSGQVMSIGARRMTSGPTSPISGVRPSEQASSAASIAACRPGPGAEVRVSAFGGPRRAPHSRDPDEWRAIVSAAYRYLRCEPIFAGIKAWWSLAEPAAPDEKLSGCAQLYHADFDYPAFIKFFLYLTDVDVDNGPFTYIEGTHREKPTWADGRHPDEAPRVAWACAPGPTARRPGRHADCCGHLGVPQGHSCPLFTPAARGGRVRGEPSRGHRIHE